MLKIKMEFNGITDTGHRPLHQPHHGGTHIFSQSLRTYLDFVCELLDLIDGGVVLVGELPELFLTALRHFLQVGALILRVAQGTLTKKKRRRKTQQSIQQRGVTDHRWCTASRRRPLPPPRTAS